MAVSRTRKQSFSRLHTDEPLIGIKNSVNELFDSPEPFVYDLSGGFFFEFFRNGQKQELGTQYTILISLGNGVGVRIFRPPRPQELLTINYISL